MVDLDWGSRPRGPVDGAAPAAAIRESSIVFGVVLGVFVLHERVTWICALAVMAVTLGVYVMRACSEIIQHAARPPLADPSCQLVDATDQTTTNCRGAQLGRSYRFNLQQPFLIEDVGYDDGHGRDVPLEYFPAYLTIGYGKLSR